MIHVTLEVDRINYGKLKRYLASKMSGLSLAGAKVLLSGLDIMDAADAEKALVKGGNLFNAQILDALNHALSDSGVHFSDIALDR